MYLSTAVLRAVLRHTAVAHRTVVARHTAAVAAAHAVAVVAHQAVAVAHADANTEINKGLHTLPQRRGGRFL